jgi:hypothetical protein
MPEYRFRFSLSISRAEYLKYYAGQAAAIRTETHEGIVIEFPARELTRWISHSGISGTFEIRFDDNHKLIDIQRLGLMA